MPIIQILVVGSAIAAFVVGLNAFRNGIQVSKRSKERMTGWPAKVVETLCLLYAAAVVAAIGYSILVIAMRS